MVSQLLSFPPRLAAALGLKRSDLIGLSADQISIPDSPAAKEAEERCESLPRSLAAHSARTYLWGAMLAARDQVSFDEELLYVACLLHDTGLQPAVSERDSDCFTLRSAALAEAQATAASWPEARRRTLAEAITLHFNPSVPLECGAEAHLLNAGAALDVVGMRAWQVDGASRATVLARHPRLGFKEEFSELLASHARAAPGCRVHALCRYGGLRALIRAAPFDS